LKRRGGVRVSTLPGIEEALRFRLPVELEPSAVASDSQVAIPPVAK
jgi:4-hydroxy-3-methylbut-2-en-1-yl diphosphate reductase